MIAIEETTAVQADGTLVLRRPELKAGELVKVIVLLENQLPPAGTPPPVRKLRQDWAGGLADLADLAGDFTSVQLQHKASAWRGD